MGQLDVEGKKYLSNNKIFADAFNYLIYDGEDIIKADALKELDTTQITVPYGNDARMPVQKYRDLLKVWNAKMDEDAIYVILGTEIQGHIHYAMPVKDGLYDMIGYSKQVEEARRSYKKQKDQSDEANLQIENGTLKVKLTGDEFLSGFKKDDKLIPIVTAVVYLGDESWDGPKSLFEMLDVKDQRLYKFLNDYKLNLISPIDMAEEDFSKFHTDLGLAMKVIKHQDDNLEEIIKETDHRIIDRDTAFFLNEAVDLGMEFEDGEDGVDMCKGMEKYKMKNEVTGAIKGMRSIGASDDVIIQKIMETFHVTREYVMALLAPQTA